MKFDMRGIILRKAAGLQEDKGGEERSKRKRKTMAASAERFLG
jgi:hypothetical protein